jgi:hypothetical protein
MTSNVEYQDYLDYHMMNMIIILSVAFILCIHQVYSLSSSCSDYQDCISCAKDQFCSWCGRPEPSSFLHHTDLKADILNTSYCYHTIDNNFSGLCNAEHGFKSYEYEDTCDVVRYPSKTQLFLSEWMKHSLPYISNMTLLDLSLPGTHNTLTYDLSLRISDGGIDGSPNLAEFLHDAYDNLPPGVEDYIRQQGRCQDLDVKLQLENGIRFLDARLMYEYSDEHPTWHSLHMIETYSEMTEFLVDIREWMDAHPSEIVVMWLSKHGSTCKTGNDQFPNVPIDVKQQYWSQIVEIFSDLLTDVTISPINTTSIETMLSRNHRLVIYVSDYVEMTNSSSYALDACIMSNTHGPSVDDEPDALIYEENTFANATVTRASLKASQSLFLVSLSTSVPYEQMWYAFKIKYLPHNQSDIEACADVFHIPNLTWCPPSLLDISNLENYYKQISLEETIVKVLDDVFPRGLPETKAEAGHKPKLTTTWGYPGAIYLNAVDVDGTIRTGTRVLWGENRNEDDVEHQVTSYAYASSLILYNVIRGCYDEEFHTSTATAAGCLTMIQVLMQQREEHPYTRWDDISTGRHADWP